MVFQPVPLEQKAGTQNSVFKPVPVDYSGGSVESLDVLVAAYPAGGISAADLQTVLEALADRIEALEP